jgi:putative DNA primase/helicase
MSKNQKYGTNPLASNVNNTSDASDDSNLAATIKYPPVNKIDTQSSSEKEYPPETLPRAIDALNCISNDLSREDWIKVATALKTEFGDSAKADFLSWSDNGKGSDRSNAKSTWSSIQAGRVTIKTLYWYARQYGYTAEKQQISKAEYAKQKAEQAERKVRQANEAIEEEQEELANQQRARIAIDEVTSYLVPATPNSTLYLKNKQSDGQGAYLLHRASINKTKIARNTYPFNDVKKGALFIPFQNHQGDCVGAQLIYNKKRAVKGSIKKGSYAYIGLAPLPQTNNTIYLGEGYATVNSALQADKDAFGIMAIDADNLPLVASQICERYPHAKIVILGDNDKSGVGQARAKEAGQYAETVLMPDWIEGQIKSTDFNDVHVIKGLDALREVLNVTSSPYPKPPKLLEPVISISQENDLEPPLSWLNDAPPSDDYYFDDGQLITSSDIPDIDSPVQPVVAPLSDAFVPVVVPNQITAERKAGLINREELSPEDKKNYLDAKKQLRKMKSNGKSVAKICHKFSLGGLIAAIDLGYLSIALHQDMKSGKTYSIKWIKENHPDVNSILYISHLEAINSSTAKRLGFTFYKNIHSDNPEIIHFTTTTLNSLPKVLEKINKYDFDMVIFDETEGVSQFLATGTITNKAQAGEAIKRVCKESKIVVLADAHMGKNTKAFQQEFIPNRNFITLKNEYKQFDGVEHFWLESRDDGFAYMKEALMNSNNPLFIYSTSSALAYKTHEFCKREGLLNGKKVLLACDKTIDDPEVIAAKETPSLFNDYDVVFGSPTLGTGLSIEANKNEEPHFRNAICFFVKDDNTGNTSSALQMPFRTRDITMLACVAVDQVVQSDMDIALDISRQKFKSLSHIKELLIKDSYRNVESAEAHHLLSEIHMIYQSEIERNDIEDKHNYFKIIKSTLVAKGLKAIATPHFQPIDNLKADLKEINATEREEAKQAVINAETKPAEEIIALRIADGFGTDVITKADRNSIKKYDLINNYFSEADISEITEEQLSDAYNLKENKNLHTKRKNLQVALQPAKEVSAICKAWTSGIGISQIFMKDEASNNAVALQQITKLDKALLEVIDLQCVDGMYYIKEARIDNSSIDSATLRKLKEVRRSFNAVSDSSMPSAKVFRNEPASAVTSLLKKRFNLQINKVSKPKLTIVERQRINLDDCEFNAIGEIIAETLSMNIDNDGLMKARSVLINENSLQTFSQSLTETIVNQYNELFVPANKSHKKITPNQKDKNIKQLFVRLAKSLLNIEFTKIKDPDDEWIIASEQLVIENLNIAEQKGNNNLRNFYSKISAEKLITSDGAINSEAKELLGVTLEIEDHIKTCLSKIHPNRHHFVLRKFVEEASKKHDLESRFTPLALANKYLLGEANTSPV